MSTKRPKNNQTKTNLNFSPSLVEADMEECEMEVREDQVYWQSFSFPLSQQEPFSAETDGNADLEFLVSRLKNNNPNANEILYSQSPCSNQAIVFSPEISKESPIEEHQETPILQQKTSPTFNFVNPLNLSKILTSIITKQQAQIQSHVETTRANVQDVTKDNRQPKEQEDQKETITIKEEFDMDDDDFEITPEIESILSQSQFGNSRPQSQTSTPPQHIPQRMELVAVNNYEFDDDETWSSAEANLVLSQAETQSKHLQSSTQQQPKVLYSHPSRRLGKYPSFYKQSHRITR